MIRKIEGDFLIAKIPNRNPLMTEGTTQKKVVERSQKVAPRRKLDVKRKLKVKIKMSTELKPK